MPTNWVPGVVVLVAGLLAGIVFVLVSMQRGGGGESGNTPLDDLEERYRLLILQLKELIAEKHNLAPERFEADRSRLELAAAAVLKERDELKRGDKHAEEKARAREAKRAKAAAVAQDTFFGRNPTLKGVLIGGGVVGFFALMGVLLTMESKPRVDDMANAPPGPMKPAQPQEEQEDPRVTKAMKILETNPEDIDAITIVAHEMLARQQFDDAQKLTDRARGVDPFHVETRIHSAVLSAIKGDASTATAELDHLADTYPDAHEALIFSGMLALQRGDKPKALEMLERYSIEAPPADQPQKIGQFIDQLRREVPPQPQ